jgi:hypothetical protein
MIDKLCGFEGYDVLSPVASSVMMAKCTYMIMVSVTVSKISNACVEELLE